MVGALSALREHDTMLKSIWREEFDSNRIQVLPLAESSKFMFSEYVYNFLRDGLLVMRLEDISKAETTLTDQYQYPHLQTGIGAVPDLKCDLCAISSWAQLLSQIPQDMPVCIEEEGDGLIYMGLIYQSHDDRVEIHEFLGSGRWEDEPTTVYHDDLTCLQAGNGYLTMYEKTLDPASQQVARADALARATQL